MRRNAALAALVLLGGTPKAASACAVCNAGDPTLTSMGAEQPYQGRLRPSFSLQYRTDEIGQPRTDQLKLSEQRLDINLAWAPQARLFVTGTMPVLRREVRYVNLAKRTMVGPGDAELRVKYFLWKDQDFGAKHLVAALLGVKLPTGQVEQGADGRTLPAELQPGTGSIDPLAGLSYAHFAWPWSVYASVQLFATTKGTEGMRASRSVRATAVTQWQATTTVALRLGLDGRADGKAMENGRAERDSGGFIGFVSPEVLLSPALDWAILLSFRQPVVQALSGFHREGSIWSVGVAKDLK